MFLTSACCFVLVLQKVAQTNSDSVLQEAGFFQAEKILDTSPASSNIGGPSDSKNSAMCEHRVSFWTELWMQVKREMLFLQRSKAQVGMRLSITFFVSTLVGSIFFDVGSANDANISVSK